MVCDKGNVRPVTYKAGWFRKYSKEQYELAYKDLQFRHMLACIHPSDDNRRACNLTELAKTHKIDRASIWRYVVWKTECQ